jgi:cobalt-zinc-cadmium efflux system outer membrane protein
MSVCRASRAALGWVLASCSVWCSVGVSAQSPPPTSLEVVLAHADQHAPSLIVARARLEEGLAARSAAERWLSDPLSVEVGAGPRVTDGGSADFDVLVSLMQPIEIGSERGLRLDAAGALRDRRDAELEAARWQVHRDVHLAYHEAIVARVRLETETRLLEFAESLAGIARRRVEAGDIGALELAMATAELAGARQGHVQASAELSAARLTLAELAGWSAAEPPTPAGDLDSPAALPTDAALVARATAEHPMVRALEAAIAEQRARAVLADREAIPTLDLGLSFAREGSAGSPANYIGLLVLGVAIPVWDANTAERAMARAELSVAQAQLDALRGAIEARVLRAASAVRAASERVRIFQTDVLPGFEQNIVLLQQAFTLGELDALEVGTATRRLLEVQANALEAFAAYHRALAELESQVGGEVVEDEAHGETDDGARHAHGGTDGGER